MKKYVVSVLLLALVFSGGCLQSTTLVEVNKDGSGRVMIREFYSPQITQMMEGMAGMMAGFAEAQAPGEVAAAGTPTSIFDEAVKARVGKMGPGVALASSKEMTNSEGWKGYTAVYTFEDINQLKVSVGDSDMGQPGLPGEPEDDAESTEGYTFRFTPGATARLEIVTPESDTDAGDDVTEEMAETADAMADMGAEMMAGMMKPMMKGMRMSLLIKVDGKVTDTNAHYVSGDNKDLVTVMDLAMDPLLDNPAAMKILMEGKDDPQAVYKLKDLGLDGVKLEEPGKTLSISFK